MGQSGDALLKFSDGCFKGGDIWLGVTEKES
jgi:hypothetical protein